VILTGIAAVSGTIALRSGGIAADPAGAGLPSGRPHLSVFGAIHPKLLEVRAAPGWQLPAAPGTRAVTRMLVVDPDGAESADDVAATGSIEPHMSFAERFASSFAALPGQAIAALVPTEQIARPARTAPERASTDQSPTHSRTRKSGRSAEVRSGQPDIDGRTAIYDIAAHVVYLPSGERLEAHSGIGKRRDDPRYVNQKNRGPTPPNVYDLTLRPGLFHGVRALRLNPVGDGNMYGRDAILAHTYMLGRNGQSMGCVSFSNYPRFLQAYLKGDVTRLVVVERLATASPQMRRLVLKSS
jgi:hypothetical protein